MLATSENAIQFKKRGFETRVMTWRALCVSPSATEGTKKAEPVPEQKPMQKWEPTKEGYLKFLVESKVGLPHTLAVYIVPPTS